MKPERIQRKRLKGFNLRTLSKATNGLDCVYVGRPTKWGNPYKPGDEIEVLVGRIRLTDEWAVWKYRQYLINSPLIEQIEELRGKNLACFCQLNHYCHADVLLELANLPQNKS